ncbi:type III secretion protein HrpV [Pseudomonas gingeri]|uniref:Type III secretion protein HrpV n=1 Tax=Pseudomonas gingeri TaxID=117681 RepID=A0A7Y7Y9H7_9PSED|nr:type III secretion protein HrpV [Pseudomonas gingeri]NWA02070.1 type III secretion protein HrpV [Pseudomonas gingeri]NWA18137.1 type III secretion protein HrpV [Pseudomonas gingeri]NWA56282.1 type III secretion protein HrpV [Pseudomonas gingeri]NWA98860.1 type III secretion protein HrpV [Pseudomonas gingeri]NWB04821.1 type III secretion protein HrpV [Pseudomonas gingeri]
MIRVSGKAAFYERVAAEQDAIWPLVSGVSFLSRREHHDWGIALHIEKRALKPQQLRETLERRFTQSHRFPNYFLFLDPQRNFVVWHAVPDSGEGSPSLDQIRQHQLMLAGLEHLNDPPR